MKILKIKACQNELKDGNVVVDVGASIGYYTLIFAKLVGKKLNGFYYSA